MKGSKNKLIFWVIVGSLALLGVIGFILRGYFHPYHCPSESMSPTIPAGSYVTINDWAYRSVDQIQRGDVIAFEPPRSPYTELSGEKATYVFRVLGLPGDELSYDKQSQFTVNGTRLEQMMRGSNHYERQRGDWYQILPGGSRESGQLTVEAGHLFVVGDNRPSALDSRYWGTVPFELVKGKVRVE